MKTNARAMWTRVLNELLWHSQRLNSLELTESSRAFRIQVLKRCAGKDRKCRMVSA